MDERLLRIDEALALVLQVAGGRLGEELVAVDDGLDRTLAADVLAAGDSPRFDCSAMDGFALGPGPTPGDFQIRGESRAGMPYAGAALAQGEAVRISTGAAVPAGAAAVVRQEDTSAIAGDGPLRVLVEVAPGANVRAAGEDMLTGALILAE